MKISEMLNTLETIMFDNDFTRMIETTENNEPGVSQFKISKLLFEPSIDYKNTSFNVTMRFESLKQYEQIIEEGTFYYMITSSFQCSGFMIDDKKLTLTFKCELSC